MEHWEVILEFAETLDREKAQILRRYSYPETRQILPPTGELDAMIGFIRELQDAIRSVPPLVPTTTEAFLEDYTNDEHARMLESVAAVLGEAKRLNQPFECHTDT